ncbi:MAG TPA: hypothetical protein VHY30_06340 [Verrucomicrobiae bacterium]|nr:hypothetical protein [Verrucomicrobiae bacterium]
MNSKQSNKHWQLWTFDPQMRSFPARLSLAQVGFRKGNYFFHVLLCLFAQLCAVNAAVLPADNGGTQIVKLFSFGGAESQRSF